MTLCPCLPTTGSIDIEGHAKCKITACIKNSFNVRPGTYATSNRFVDITLSAVHGQPEHTGTLDCLRGLMSPTTRLLLSSGAGLHSIIPEGSPVPPYVPPGSEIHCSLPPPYTPPASNAESFALWLGCAHSEVRRMKRLRFGARSQGCLRRGRLT